MEKKVEILIFHYISALKEDEHEQRKHFSWSGFHFKPTALLTANITFLVKITCEFYMCSKVGGVEKFPFSFFQSHGLKQVKWTYKEQSHSAETKSLVTMESDSDESQSHTLTAEDERGYEQMGIDSLLQQECVP